MYATLLWKQLHNITKYMQNTSVLSILIHDVIPLPDATSCDKRY